MKDVKGFEGLYAITEDGRVWSYLRNKWLKPSKIRGYKRISLYKDGKIKTFLIHRLVYEAFKGAIPEGLTVDHIDANSHNNHISNLQLLTHAENARKAHKGKKHSVETRRKISEGMKRRKAETILYNMPDKLADFIERKIREDYPLHIVKKGS